MWQNHETATRQRKGVQWDEQTVTVSYLAPPSATRALYLRLFPPLFSVLILPTVGITQENRFHGVNRCSHVLKELASLTILKLLGQEDSPERINFSELLCPGQGFVQFKWLNSIRNKQDEMTSHVTREIITKAYILGISFKWHT